MYYSQLCQLNFIALYFNNTVIQLRCNLEINNLEINYLFSFEISCIFNSEIYVFCKEIYFFFFVKNKY